MAIPNEVIAASKAASGGGGAALRDPDKPKIPHRKGAAAAAHAAAVAAALAAGLPPPERRKPGQRKKQKPPDPAIYGKIESGESASETSAAGVSEPPKVADTAAKRPQIRPKILKVSAEKNLDPVAKAAMKRERLAALFLANSDSKHPTLTVFEAEMVPVYHHRRIKCKSGRIYTTTVSGPVRLCTVVSMPTERPLRCPGVPLLTPRTTPLVVKKKDGKPCRTCDGKRASHRLPRMARRI